MFNLYDLEKIIENEDKVILKFTVKKHAVEGFLMLLNGLSTMGDNITGNIREARSIYKKRLEQIEQNRIKKFNEIKKGIRATVEAEKNKGEKTRQAFKKAREVHQPYNFLVKQVQDEYRAIRELKIIKLSNEGKTSKKIAKIMKMSPEAVRKAKHLAKLRT